MPGMSPEEMAQLQAQAGKDQGPSIIDTAKQVGEGLNKLGAALERGQGSPEEKQQMAQIISLYADLVEKKLGGEPSSGAPEEPEAPSAVPMEGGLKGVPMTMNMKQ